MGIMSRSTFGRGSRTRRGLIKVITALFTGWCLHKRLQSNGEWSPFDSAPSLGDVLSYVTPRWGRGGASKPWSQGALLVYRACSAFGTLFLAFLFSEWSRKRRAVLKAKKLQKKQLARPESGVEPTHAAVKRAQVEANVRAALARRKRDGDRASGGGASCWRLGAGRPVAVAGGAESSDGRDHAVERRLRAREPRDRVREVHILDTSRGSG